MEPGERPEDLFQRLTSFVEDNLLTLGGGISHHGEDPEADEEVSPSLENMIVLTWLRLIHKDLPSLAKQRYGTELRAKTLATLKPEISQALDTLLDEIRTSSDSKVLRTAILNGSKPALNMSDQWRSPHRNEGRRQTKTCILCKSAGRPKFDHFLSQCTFLPPADKKFMSRARQTISLEDHDDNDET